MVNLFTKAKMEDQEMSIEILSKIAYGRCLRLRFGPLAFLLNAWTPNAKGRTP
jgi:hypothetical protein